ncbi:hypothetical protein ET445_06230 [Agromyces protaetiae]|uniref:Uncharacterized protein n=1 Tax=Agromyces protaetiae TaxID=2509455 RepID=A0A4V0YH02_9MICO|nr:hypothetical protein [Agromyces protaetiae]QAY73001.1 hypothetical protein ET445_06230 [Agromyces protaetiae]
MPRPRLNRTLPLAVVGLAVLLGGALTGCTDSQAPAPTPAATEAPAAEPIFASDEEALAAAEEAYEAYLQALDQAASDAAGNSSGIDEFVTDSQVKDSLATLAARGLRIQGTTSYDSMRLESWHESAGAASLTVYVCLDSSGTRVLDASGNDVTPTDRAARTPLVVGLLSDRTNPRVPRPNESETWRGHDFC